jgi:hypothetical protein
MSPGPDTLIVTIGHSPLPAVMAVRALKPKNVILAHSVDTLPVAHRVKAVISSANVSMQRVSAKEPAQAVSEFSTITGLETADICTTSGTKAMSVALDIARHNAGGDGWRSWHVLDDLGAVVSADGSSVPIPNLGFSIHDFAVLHGWAVEVADPTTLAAASVALPTQAKKGTAGQQETFVKEVEGLLVSRCPGRVERIKRITDTTKSISVSRNSETLATWAIVGDYGVTVIGVSDPANANHSFWQVITVADALGGEHARVGLANYWGPGDAADMSKPSDETVLSLHHRVAREPTVSGAAIEFGVRIFPARPGQTADMNGFLPGGYLDHLLKRDGQKP